jgi:outer membrane protein
MKNIIVRHIVAILFCGVGVASAHADDFTDMLVDVNQNHPVLKAEREQLAATKQGVYQAYAGFMPSANAEYARGRQRIQYNQLTPEYQRMDTKQLVVTQPIFNGGGTVAQIGGAEARLAGEEARFKQVQQEVLLSATTAYVDVVEKQRVLATVRENIQALTQHLEATRIQFAAGELTVTDVAQSEARLARAHAELQDAEAAMADAHAAYIRETGVEPTADKFPQLPEMLPESEEALRAEQAAHPAVIEAKQNEEVADYAIDERVAALLPNVRLEGQLSALKGSRQPSVDYTNDRSVMMRVSIPLFQSGAEYSRIVEAQHQYQRSKNQTDDITRNTLKTALREWHNYQAAGEAMLEHAKAVAAGKTVLESVQKERMVGTRTVLDILNAQDELQAAQINLIRAQSRHVLSAYRLLASQGKLESVLANAML